MEIMAYSLSMLDASIKDILPRYIVIWITMVLVLLGVHGNKGYHGDVIQECPALCHCLEKGSILTCRRMGLHHIPHPLSTTMFFDLDHNQISLIYNESFSNTPRLEILSVEDNDLTYIDLGAFSVLPELRILRLGSNHLTSFPRGMFWNNRYLEVLDLSGNLFSVIPDYAMHPLHNLKSLNISYNRLESPYLGPGFKYTSQMSCLDLTGNTFPSLEAQTFQVIQDWDSDTHHSLNLSYCGITHIHPRTFSRILNVQSLSLAGNVDLPHLELQAALLDLQTSELQILDLSWMNITDVYDFFRTFQHQNLLELDLSHNLIQTIQRGTFFHLVKVNHLDLSFNKLSSIEDLSSLSRLVSLRLSFNNLRYLDSTVFESLHSLQSLDLSHNALTQIQDTPFQTLFDLQSLDISCNHISVVHINAGLENLHELYASYNFISDLDFIQHLRHLRHLDLSHNVIRRLNAPLFTRGHNFNVVNFSNNAIFDIHPLALMESSHDTLDLSYNQLMSLTNIGWFDIRRVYLSHNRIYNLTASTFQTLHSLEELYLDHNQLYGFPRDLFVDLSALRRLDLSYNPLGTYLLLPDIGHAIKLQDLRHLDTLSLYHTQLPHSPVSLLLNLTSLTSLDLGGNELTSMSDLPFGSLQKLQKLYMSHNRIQIPDPDRLSLAPRLHVVDFSHNPFVCSCDLMPFRTWAVASLASSDVNVLNLHNSSYYQCVSPPEWKGVAILNFHLNSHICTNQEKAVMFTSLGCVILALGVAMTIAILRYRWWQRRKAATTTEYRFIDDSSTSALTGSNGSSTMQMNNHHQGQGQIQSKEKQWV